MNQVKTAPDTTGIHDFDFLMGRWNVHHKRLVKRLQNCQEWQEFDAFQEGSPLLGGLGNMDEMRTDELGTLGISLRFFNLQTHQWSIYWVSTRDGMLQSPVVGSFTDGIGVFEAPDEHEGTPILVRFTWSQITPTTAHWEQAFTTDNWRTWEVNWISDFTRIVD
jgi:hypothetical protein